MRAARGSGVRAGPARAGERRVLLHGPGACGRAARAAAWGRRLRVSGVARARGAGAARARGRSGGGGRRVRAAARAEELPRVRSSPAARASRLRHGARDRRVYSNHGVGQQV